jgi:hypothetical protein
VDGDVEPGIPLHLIEGSRDLFDRFVHPGEGDAHDGHHPDGVLVNVRRQVVPSSVLCSSLIGT